MVSFQILMKTLPNSRAALIETVFGYDLRSYAYVSFAELWNGEPSTEALRAIRGILTDTCAGMEAGERMPVGYLYQGQAVYTIVEQPDGSLNRRCFIRMVITVQFWDSCTPMFLYTIPSPGSGIFFPCF